ncbi:MAG: SoxR reducing system RseC family protein [Deltaproteobacteria bacterium]|nr:SoxR reducing system RseC family protein [Deltaproteobacteria bacterium]MBW1929679.1 SoxR reducing system RseC family protein [Deltaproteobacteria bacterium]MBW2023969.1 SoxR reducing system RseC family protein [Deltaproteobacteria bacterium]MBW2124704.1 SoxR reducing system RseC family protein [Deltaproteobacteria bacterium]RLB10814.1 MAG: hypothetical protein DRG63_13600 [Deltaproteobacteria bacterium]
MVKEQGVIEKVFSRKAIVKVQRHSACEHCDSRGMCDVFEGKEMEVEVINDLQAKVGDRVELSVPGRSLLKLSLFVYFIPVIALLIGAYLGNLWAPSLNMSPPLASILAGGLAMGVTFFVLKRIDRSALSKEYYIPRVTRVILSAEPQLPADDSK